MHFHTQLPMLPLSCRMTREPRMKLRRTPLQGSAPVSLPKPMHSCRLQDTVVTIRLIPWVNPVSLFLLQKIPGSSRFPKKTFLRRTKKTEKFVVSTGIPDLRFFLSSWFFLQRFAEAVSLPIRKDMAGQLSNQ